MVMGWNTEERVRRGDHAVDKVRRRGRCGKDCLPVNVWVCSERATKDKPKDILSLIHSPCVIQRLISVLAMA